MSRPEPEWHYIGDGLYARHDGYHVVLRANGVEELNPTVYLDPTTLRSLADLIEQKGWL